MTRQEFQLLLEDAPVIAAVKNSQGLSRCLGCDCRAVFVLYGDVLEIPSMVARITDAGKAAFVHMDLIDGLSPREIAVDFIARNTQAAGILSTKAALVRRAGALGLIGIQRIFLLDSMSLETAGRIIEGQGADFVELLPGMMPKIIRRLSQSAKTPLITGGLISDKEDVLSALSAGALGVSTTNERVWFL